MQLATAEPTDRDAMMREPTMPPPLSAPRFELADPRVGRITCYADGPAGPSGQPPLLLIHSVNAAASAYEIKPLFEHYRRTRQVYALDLPGFGLSDRADRIYTPRLMTDAILLAANEISRRHGGAGIDAIAVSLGCEFAARAGAEAANLFRTLGLISPTGFDRRAEAAAKTGGDRNATRAMPWLRNIFTVPLWKHRFFSLLTSRASIRFFLRKTFGRKEIDEGLLEYDYITTHQPGAENAPYSFVSGYMFSVHALKLYQALAMPVWMVHGVRGDFVDYNGKHAVEGLPNWRIQVMQTGAMPHFEQLDKVVASYDDFLARAAGA
ncbi:alpha/beta hydrolase [Bradyrhizobium sp. SSBR45G]|uniref:alpha/beta fold hydrolase n=1 Tax=unclassified Bradyrhizobium TaxID=2631580 RepID=UPI002342AE30|nr:MULTISPECIES: alpha/beta hydrolase [unclassified Bradyrhizobium]GLH78465.1 alpha/beta hydrolase [Bradyrhizobium sp. SSBR45G]GLH86248.1 alpha/beta hydrolase [Bradyrhizobium sp. SSBR45R]